MRSFYRKICQKNGILKTDFISRCFIYIGKTVYVASIYPFGNILRGILIFSICQIRLYVTFVMSHKPLHVTPRLATYDWLIGRYSLYCKLLLYLTYSNMIEKTEIFSKKKMEKSKSFFFEEKNSGDHLRSSVCTLKNKYFFFVSRDVFRGFQNRKIIWPFMTKK